MRPRPAVEAHHFEALGTSCSLFGLGVSQARLLARPRRHRQRLDGGPAGFAAWAGFACQHRRGPPRCRARPRGRRMAGWHGWGHRDASRPGRRDEQRAEAQMGRSAPPHRPADGASIQEWIGRSFCRGGQWLRRRGRRQDSAAARSWPGDGVLRGARARMVVLLMTAHQFFWVLSRVGGLGSYAALAVALVTGIALRTAVLDWLGSNRALRSLHEYTTVLWSPLAVVHLAALLLDRTSRIGLIDLVLPFHSTYGTLGIGFGTLAVDVLLVVTVTSYLKRRMAVELWKWLHRLSYVPFPLHFLHPLL